ncbi:MAG: hypothetical protein KatS3mg119_1609 [Rhodothalassiaceae bacterium]|nr:MAG: hypothetical protein KatS3mg119_1609 [Rhodothalassiaceae bacterium]
MARAGLSEEAAIQEILDGIEDRIAEINELLDAVREGRSDAGVAVGLLRQHAHSVKSMAASAHVPVLQRIAMRFEAYLSPLARLDGEAVEDAQTFADRLAEALDGNLALSEEEIADRLARLPGAPPASASFDPNEVQVRDIDIMLVMSPGTATNFVTRELAECGYRMINCFSTLDALVLAGQMKPHLVIVSNVMPELSGVDFACAMRAMPSTKDIPVAMLTSEKRGSPALAGLPEEVPLLSKSGRFADDVTRVFQQLGIL